MERVIHVLVAGGNLKHKQALERMVYAMARAQVKVNLDISVWKIGNQRRANVDLHTEFFPRSGRGFFLSRLIKDAVNNLPSKSTLHLHGSFVPEHFFLLNYIKKQKKDIRVIVSSHGGYSEISLGHLSPFKKAYFYFAEHRLIRNASMVHLLGPAESSGYKFYVNSKTPFVTLPHGLTDFDKSELNDNEDLKNPDKFIVCYNGEFDINRKGIDTLIESFKFFSEEVNSHVDLWLIGRGNDEIALKKLVSHHGLEDKVKLFSNHDRQLVKNLVQQTHVFVQPSRIDGIPVTALEAASLGVPLLITEETNLGKFIRQYDAGWCLSSLNTETLKQMLHEVYFIYQTDEVKAQTMGRNAYRMIREELNWNALARKWKEVYLSVFS